MRKVKIIGVGGIGSYLVEPLARYLNFLNTSVEITIVDGDAYESKNKQRQQFSKIGNKAEVTVKDLSLKFPNILFKAQPVYIDKKNVISLIRENDEVFLCVDNHSTRNIVSKRCEELDNVLLINGANEYTDGDVFVYAKRDGKNAKTNNRSLIEAFPKIADPQDLHPAEKKQSSCQVEAQSSPQLLFMNLTIAAFMCNCYYAFHEGKFDAERVCVDIITQSARKKPEPVI
jgi:molybdopterin/thiamine biosynthesis adenylyltransferase